MKSKNNIAKRSKISILKHQLYSALLSKLDKSLSDTELDILSALSKDCEIQNTLENFRKQLSKGGIPKWVKRKGHIWR
jgi:uncharacterized protein YbcV (DUF1398 family)